MKSYYYPSLFFRKKWVWFSDPYDVKGADMVTFFSYNDLVKEGFRKKEGITTIINLSEDLDLIWNKMRKNFIRKQIKRGENNGIAIRLDNNFSEFNNIYSNFRKEKKIKKDKFEVFEKNGLLCSAYFEEKAVAGGVFIAAAPYFRAWVLASARFNQRDGRMREIIGQANRMIIWEAMKYAKNENFKYFDFGGINAGENDPLSEFKEAFGGARKNCYYYSRVYSPILKFLIKMKKYFK